jgi:hypothetical protein
MSQMNCTLYLRKLVTKQCERCRLVQTSPFSNNKDALTLGLLGVRICAECDVVPGSKVLYAGYHHLHCLLTWSYQHNIISKACYTHEHSSHMSPNTLMPQLIRSQYTAQKDGGSMTPYIVPMVIEKCMKTMDEVDWAQSLNT